MERSARGRRLAQGAGAQGVVGVGVGGVVVVIRTGVVMAVARFVLMGPGGLTRRQGHTGSNSHERANPLSI